MSPSPNDYESTSKFAALNFERKTALYEVYNANRNIQLWTNVSREKQRVADHCAEQITRLANGLPLLPDLPLPLSDHNKVVTLNGSVVQNGALPPSL